MADIFSGARRALRVVFFSFWLSHVPEERFDEFWALVRSALRPDGRVFLVDSGPADAAPAARRACEVTRSLADGREFTIVKRFWQPDELAERVRSLGFELDLALTGTGLFLYGGSA